jgi:hypothetical protein
MKKKKVIRNKTAFSEMKKENKIIFTLIAAVLFLMAAKVLLEQQDFPDKQLQEDADKILNAITTNNLRVLKSDFVDEKGIEELMKKDYISLKNDLGIKSDFCIHFEDNKGNLIRINGMSAGIGSSNVKVNGISCGKK